MALVFCVQNARPNFEFEIIFEKKVGTHTQKGHARWVTFLEGDRLVNSSIEIKVGNLWVTFG